MSLRGVFALAALVAVGCPAPPSGSPAPGPEPRPEASPSAAPEAGGGGPVKAELAHVADARLRTWLRALTAVPEARFVPRARSAELAGALSVYATQSAGASGFNLLPAADPHRGAREGAVWSAAAAGPEGIDLVRCRYRALGRAMELREGWNLQALRIELEAPIDREELEALLGAVVRVERLDGSRWRFALPERLTAPAHLTNVGAPPVERLSNRDQRVDVLVAQDAVTLVFYKRVAQLAVFNRDDAWFRPRTREALQLP